MSPLQNWPKCQDALEEKVLEVWRGSKLCGSSADLYLRRVRLFRTYCKTHGLDETEELTLSGANAFMRAYKGPRLGRKKHGKDWIDNTRSALHSWSSALKALGEIVPEWKPIPTRQYHPVVAEFVEFRKMHRGVRTSSLVRDISVASGFLAYLRSIKRGVERTRVKDIDSFVSELRKKYSRRVTADHCSAFRGFLRFLSITGRIGKDLAPVVCAPRYRIDEFPPKVLPWEDIRKILRAIPRDTTVGRRDFAMLLLMATYALGAAEITRMCLEDIHWREKLLKIRRPKTDVPLELPLLPAIARALAAYLKHSRPKYITLREVFVTTALPHRNISSSVLRHQIRVYAGKAGLRYETYGSHLFRRSHATRQVDSGVSHKIVSDILGHRRPASTSVYIRVAFRRLRAIALPVPR